MTDVRDTGIGIKKKDLQKLFRFFGKVESSKSLNKGGMGLGLTISKMILSQMGGTIECSSIEGKGSTFRFSLPVLDDSSPAQVSRKRQESSRLLRLSNTQILEEDKSSHRLTMNLQ